MTTEKTLLEFDVQSKNLLPALKKINASFGYVSEADAQKVADYFSVPFSQVFETASFYDLIKTKKQPDLVIQVCSDANCEMIGSHDVIRAIENQLHTRVGDEFNPRVKLEAISCLGQCGSGPIMVVNGNIFTKVTLSSVYDILKNYI